MRSSNASSLARTTVFYDGFCGLCHGFVRFVLAEGRSARDIEFSPLQGELFHSKVPKSKRAGLPDSIVVLTHTGRLLVRAEAVSYVLGQLGGAWRLAAVVAGLLPQSLADRCYDSVARLRRYLFHKPGATCPIVPPDLQARFRF